MSATHYSFHSPLLDPHPIHWITSAKKMVFKEVLQEPNDIIKKDTGVRSYDMFLVYWTSFCWHVIQKKLFKKSSEDGHFIGTAPMSRNSKKDKQICVCMYTKISILRSNWNFFLFNPWLLIHFDKAQNALQREWGNIPFSNWNGICWRLPFQLVQ